MDIFSATTFSATMAWWSGLSFVVANDDGGAGVAASVVDICNKESRGHNGRWIMNDDDTTALKLKMHHTLGRRNMALLLCVSVSATPLLCGPPPSLDPSFFGGWR